MPNAYLYQLIKLKNTKKGSEIYVLKGKKAALPPTITYRTGKFNDETQVYGKKPELTMGVKWETNKVDDESAQTTGFLHTTNEITVPIAYLYQLIKLKNTTKGRGTYVLDGKNAAHPPTITYRTGKLSDETQVT